MSVSDKTILITGGIALGLFLILLILLLFRLYQRWKGGLPFFPCQSDKVVAEPTRRKSKLIMPEFTSTFPTSSYHIQLPIPRQFNHHNVSHPVYEELHSSFSEESLLDPTPELGRSKKKSRHGRRHSGAARSCSSDIDISEKRSKRFLSDSEVSIPMTLEQQDRSGRKQSLGHRGRSRSDVTRPTRRRSSTGGNTGSTLFLTETSGQLEFLLFYDANKRSLEITVIQVFDIDIRPKLFVGQFETVDMDQLWTEMEKPCLVRKPDKSLMFSNKGALGLSVNVAMFPRKAVIGSTAVKFGLDNPSFNESFVVPNHSLESLMENLLRFQIMVQYGEDARPFVIGESVLPLKNLRNNRLIPYQQYLQLPVDEIELESTLGSDMFLGQLTVSLCYKLLRQQLNVRVVGGKDLPRIGLYGQPSTSVKVSVYFCGYRLFKEYTAVKKKTSEPTYNESFDFDIAQDKLSQTAVLLEVRHHGAMHRTILGYVHIGNEADGLGHDQWDEVLDFAEYNREHSHDIQRKKPTKIS